MMTPILATMALVITGLYFIYQYYKSETDLRSLEEGVIKLMKKLKLSQNITIHYGDRKQLTFIKGELQ